MLVIRKLSPELNKILPDVIKVINYTKMHAFYSCLFDQFCEDMDAENNNSICTSNLDVNCWCVSKYQLTQQTIDQQIFTLLLQLICYPLLNVCSDL